MDCPECGHWNSEDRDFCEICGQDLYGDFDDNTVVYSNVQMRTCEYCGMMNPIDVQFCRHCEHDVYEQPPRKMNNYSGYQTNNQTTNKKDNSNSNSGYKVCCLLFFLFWLFSVLTYHPNI